MLADLADAVDVVRRLHGAVVPLGVLVHGCEEIDFHDDAMLACVGHEVIEAAKKGIVPAAQIEAIAAVDIACLFTPGPRTDQPSWPWRQRVPLDLERSGRLHVGPWKSAREVESIRGQRGELLLVVEIEIENRPIMFPGRYQNCRLAAEKEIVRVTRMQRQRLGRNRSGAEHEDNHAESLAAPEISRWLQNSHHDASLFVSQSLARGRGRTCLRV